MATLQGPFYAALGANISRLRHAARLTQHDLAVKVGLTRTSITNIEKGRQPVQAHLLVQLAAALKTTVAELLPPSEEETIAELPGNLDDNEQAWVQKIIKGGEIEHGR